MIIDSPAIASSINEYYFGYDSGYELSPFIYINKEITNTSSYIGTEYYEYNTVVIDCVEYVEYSTHLLTFVDKARQTCVKDGHTEYRYCEECDYEYEVETPVLEATGCKTFHWIILLLLLLLIIGICLYYRYRLSKKERQQEKANQNS